MLLCLKEVNGDPLVSSNRSFWWLTQIPECAHYVTKIEKGDSTSMTA
jgi:hypothetical protein